MSLRRLGLDLTHKDVLRLGELVLVECMMLHCGSPSVWCVKHVSFGNGSRVLKEGLQPDCSWFTLNQHASACVDRDLSVCRVVNVVVSSPEP